ncbi:ABC transporter substrate-binding protein [Desulfovibrio sp. OttesenSCG-928-G15]|nr:ABC transporter substrate-binding protein [Desulfovibrio sp. OttesenSCG-928-G15]
MNSSFRHIFLSAVFFSAFRFRAVQGRVRALALRFFEARGGGRRAHSFRFCLALSVCLVCLAEAAPCRAGVSVVDDSGKRISLASPAGRIIPLYAGLSEILRAMGLETTIVARTAADESLAASLPVIGTHMRPNVEVISALAPDLVVQFEGRSEAGLAAQMLEKQGLVVARFKIASFADFFSCLERLGVLTGSEDAAGALAASYRQRLDALKARKPEGWRGPKVFFEVRYPNLLGAGGGNMVSDVIAAAGGSNCLGEHAERMVRLGEEVLLATDPDVYLMQQGPMNKSPVPLDERPAYCGLRSLRTGFVRVVPESVYSRPGPGSIQAAEELSALFIQWYDKRDGAKP